MLDAKLVSIITPVFNSERFIEATIRSVQAQTYPNWEMLVLIDKGTKDTTAEIVNRLSAEDSRIRLVDVPGGRNVSDARNFGFRTAKGKFIAFLDADDIWLPNKLERQLEEMRRTGAALTYTGYRRLTLEGSDMGRKISVPSRLVYADLLKHNPIACLTVVIDQEQTGPLEMGNDIHEDYSLWLKILRSGHKAVGLNDDLARYRIVPGSRSSNKLLMAAWRWRVYRENERLPIGKAIYYFFWYAYLTLSKHSRF